MNRFISAILLSVYGFVSLLGHAGFDVLGLHSHGHAPANLVASQASGERHVHQCEHSHGYGSGDEHRHGYEDRHEHTDHDSDDCTVCQFFGLLKTQIFASSFPIANSGPVYGESFHASDVLVMVDFMLLPMPRGPPSLYA